MKRAVFVLLSVASCRGCVDPPAPSGGVRDAAPAESGAASGPRDAAVGPELVDAARGAAVDAGSAALLADAGASECRRSYGPAELPFRGPAALLATATELRVIANDAGHPHVFPIAIPTGPAAVTAPRPASIVAMRWPPCEVAGSFVYCPGRGGVILRTPLEGGEAREIAKGRAGTKLAAATLGEGHAAVAYLDLHRTSEGDVLQAFVAVDEAPPVRLSDEGAGATALRFLPHGEAPVAMYLDARAAMVPVHARVVRRGPAGGAELGDDTVLYVGGAAERGIDFTIAPVGGRAFALVPMARETVEFGMALVPVESPPRENVAAEWSLYPNGLDPAPIAATAARDGKGAWVARVRPRHREPGAPRILELGKIEGGGAFTSFGELAVADGVTDLAIAEDRAGGIWVTYGDTTVTWLERRVCPVAR